jgi:4-carboxymuconolactone decarboxylase
MLSIAIAMAVGASLLGFASVVGAQTSPPRFRELPKDGMTDAQKRVYDAIAGGPRGSVRGPFAVLLRSPELADRVQKLGEHLRFHSTLPPRLNEFAILINARFWGSKYEWYAHRPIALKGGLAESIAHDVANGRRPAGSKDDEALVFDFCSVLHRQHFVDDALFQRAVSTLGEQGVVDLIGVSGYYTLVSMVLNVAEVPRPAGVASPW